MFILFCKMSLIRFFFFLDELGRDSYSVDALFIGEHKLWLHPIRVDIQLHRVLIATLIWLSSLVLRPKRVYLVDILAILIIKGYRSMHLARPRRCLLLLLVHEPWHILQQRLLLVAPPNG